MPIYQWWLITSSQVFDVAEYGPYESQNEALAAGRRIEQIAKEIGDGIERSFAVVRRAMRSTETKRYMTCGCCGAFAGWWVQHWNQDDGKGLCMKCRDWLQSRGMSEQDMRKNYGEENVNYGEEATCEIFARHP